MAFDEKAFMRAEAAPRTDVVPVPALAAFFGEGEAAQITVRGLSGAELARVHEKVAKNGTIEAVVRALSAGSSDPEKVKELLGMATTKQPDEIVRRIHMLVQASVQPALSQPAVIKLADACPADFYVLTNKITELTGLGAELGKPKPSGSEPTCETA